MISHVGTHSIQLAPKHILILLTSAFYALCKLISFCIGCRVRELQMPNSIFLYVNVEGDDELLLDTYERISADMGEIFKLSRIFGLYGNEPAKTRKRCKAILGVMVNAGEQGKVARFSKGLPHYKKVQIPSTRCLSGHYPYWNCLSFILIGATVYPKLKAHVKKEHLEMEEQFLEIFHFLSAAGSVEVRMPLEHFDSFNI